MDTKPHTRINYLDDNIIKIWEDDYYCYHRDDGPAIVWSCGTMFWYKKGLRHRNDGPACIIKNDSTSHSRGVWFYIDNENITLDVRKWIKEHDYPEWIDENSWSDGVKLHFKLTFG